MRSETEAAQLFTLDISAGVQSRSGEVEEDLAD